MIYITGDTHGAFRIKFCMENFPEQRGMTKDDYVIICGDYGGVWDAKGETRNERDWLDWFEMRPFTLLFVDGNHENFERLNQYPEKKWHGGRVHELRPHVLHLMRGQVFDLGGKSFFTFGGASSQDISGGILDQDSPEFDALVERAKKAGKPYRINHVSWWEQELANEEEMEEGRRNLKAHRNRVDFIVTHCCSSITQRLMDAERLIPDRETDYLDEIRENVSFQKWFFGHYHDNRNVTEKEILLYEQFVRVV